MRSKAFLGVAGFLTVLIALTVGIAIYDSNRNDEIAEGISVGGVEIGGMSRAEAERALERRLASSLEEPLVIRYDKEKFKLGTRKTDLTVDVAASVEAAIERTRSDNLFVRTYRGLTGGTIDEDLDVSVSYDEAAVQKMVDRVAGELNRPAVDAEVDISLAGVETVKEQTGIEVNTGFLAKALERKLITPEAKRELRVRVSKTKPKVTTAELAEQYPSVIVVNRSTFTLQLYENLKPTLNYTVAIGAAGYDTPTGLYEIQNKQVDPYWTVPNSDWAGDLAGQVIPPGPSNPLKSRWMGIYNGAGIHGTDATYSLGSAASHGCVRMAIPDVEELYEHVEVGTPIYIG